MSEFSIGDVAQMSGLAPSAIRYYESVGVVPKPLRRSGRRVYNEKWMRSLAFVIIAKDSGFSIKEIKQLVHQFARTNSPPSKSFRKAARGKYEELEAQRLRIDQMQRLLKIGMGCGCASIEECLDLKLPFPEANASDQA